MQLALIADTFVPARNSAAVQLYDLARALAAQGHVVHVLVPATALEGAQGWCCETSEGVQVWRLRAPQTKDVGYVRRTLAEMSAPFAMGWQLFNSPLRHVRWDALVWYSPSIFLTPLVHLLQKRHGCKSYLIVRDIFPDWALDMGLIQPGWVFRAFKAIANYQFKVASVIGIQTEGNRSYFVGPLQSMGNKVAVLHNWLAERAVGPCRIDLSQTPLAGRVVLVYAGNMGVAQGMDVLLDLASEMAHDPRYGFAFVGRGQAYPRLVALAQERQLGNVWFHDEIDPDEIPGLYAQCHVGLLALDPRHKSHNIPGKFLSYMHAGMPVLASVNAGNDLVELIEQQGVGAVSTEHSAQALALLAKEMVQQLQADPNYYRPACVALAQRQFSADAAAKQVLQGVTSAPPNL
jgi:glycosyltransferase involved in cell wall biosynthesis